MNSGEYMRHVGRTEMNDHSSRSHTIFRIVIESRLRSGEDQGVRVATLNLVDLAGSERASHTKATGERLAEGSHINKSLLTLGIVINRLCNPVPGQHIPYRDSKLTHILQNALGGNARTAVICTVTPASVHLAETMSTLQFANSAKNIQNSFSMNEVVDDQTMIKRLTRQVHDLRNRLDTSDTGGEEFKQMKQDYVRNTRVVEELRKKLAHVEALFVQCDSAEPRRTRRNTIAMGSLVLDRVISVVEPKRGVSGGNGDSGALTTQRDEALSRVLTLESENNELKEQVQYWQEQLDQQAVVLESTSGMYESRLEEGLRERESLEVELHGMKQMTQNLTEQLDALRSSHSHDVGEYRERELALKDVIMVSEKRISELEASQQAAEEDTQVQVAKLVAVTQTYTERKMEKVKNQYQGELLRLQLEVERLEQYIRSIN